MTLFSNLIDFGQKLIDFGDELKIVPSLGFNRLINQQSLFYESEMIANYDPRLPIRPYTYEQGVMLRRCVESVTHELHELQVKFKRFTVGSNHKDTFKWLKFTAWIKCNDVKGRHIPSKEF